MSSVGDPPPIDAVKRLFDENVASYSAEIEKALGPLAPDHDFFMRHKARLIRRFVAKRFPDRRIKVLDAGCGMGLMHQYLDDPSIDLHGADISSEALRFGGQRNPHVHYQLLTGGRLPYADGEFDVVVATNVLHHVPVAMWEDFVREMARVAGTNGFVMVIEHNPFNPATRWVVRSCDIDRDAVLLAPRTLRRLLRGAGLRVMSTRHILFTPFAGPFFRRLDDWLARVPMGAQYVMVASRAAGAAD